ncbi:MAG TPA: hypothetical protein VK463_07315 [Desulfomonilaceae bacterium]|nr:hypothetical protein [Desulfomonilaceae bacterium]
MQTSRGFGYDLNFVTQRSLYVLQVLVHLFFPYAQQLGKIPRGITPFFQQFCNPLSYGQGALSSCYPKGVRRIPPYGIIPGERLPAGFDVSAFTC